MITCFEVILCIFLNAYERIYQKKLGTYEIEVGERKKIYTSKETDAGWSSTDTDVLTIVNQAMSYIEVSAVGEGSASITAKHGDEVYSIDFSVTLKQADAEIGGKKYKTLNQAFKKVKDGQTINLLHNIVLSGEKGITLSKDAAYAVNLNGYRISANKRQDILVKKGNVTFRNGETTSNIYLTVGVNATASLNKMACYNLENEGSIKILNSYIGELPPWSILNGICDLVEKKKSAEYSFGISVPL